jgi:hypothetical protein
MFCAELFFLLKKKDNLSKFITHFKLKHGNYDVGYEVSFYRDLSKEYNIKWEKFLHRAFDLALFSENDIYIIEAKAHDGFDNEQLDYFEEDKKLVLEILRKINPKTNVDIHLWALISSNYNPKSETKSIFEKIITWKDVSELYDNNKIFNRADGIHNK